MISNSIKDIQTILNEGLIPPPKVLICFCSIRDVFFSSCKYITGSQAGPSAKVNTNSGAAGVPCVQAFLWGYIHPISSIIFPSLARHMSRRRRGDERERERKNTRPAAMADVSMDVYKVTRIKWGWMYKKREREGSYDGGGRRKKKKDFSFGACEREKQIHGAAAHGEKWLFAWMAAAVASASSHPLNIRGGGKKKVRAQQHASSFAADCTRLDTGKRWQ